VYIPVYTTVRYLAVGAKHEPLLAVILLGLRLAEDKGSLGTSRCTQRSTMSPSTRIAARFLLLSEEV